MLGSFFGTAGAKAGTLESKLMLYIILGVAAIVIISVLLDGIKKYIRGLDTVALGALMIWLGTQSSKLTLVSVLTNLLYLVGGTLVAMGLIVFIIIRMIRRRRKVNNSRPPMPKEKAVSDSEPPMPKTEAAPEDKPKDEAKHLKADEKHMK
jgi:hypothetical protein